MMRIKSIDFNNRTFETENGDVFPFVFDIDNAISLVEFQELVNRSEQVIKQLLSC